MNPKQDEQITKQSQNRKPLRSPPPAANTGRGNVMIPSPFNGQELSFNALLPTPSSMNRNQNRVVEKQAPVKKDEFDWHPVPVLPRPRILPAKRFEPEAGSSNGKQKELIMTNRGKAKMTEEEEEKSVNWPVQSVDTSDTPPMLTMRAAPETSTQRRGIELAEKRRKTSSLPPAFEITQSEMQVMSMRHENNVMYRAHILGMQIGMNMGMQMGMNRAITAIQNLVAAGTTVPPAAAHMGPIFGMDPYHMPHVPAAPHSSRMPPANLSDNFFNSLGDLVPPGQPRMANLNFFDFYEQYLQEMMNQSNAGEAGTSGGQEKPKNI